MKRVLKLFSSVLTFAAYIAAQPVSILDSADGNLEIVPVRGNIYMLGGAGANITLSIGSDGVLVVDTGRAEFADKVLETVNRFSSELATFGRPLVQSSSGGSGTVLAGYRPPKPIRFMVNTSALPDHVGGNVKLATAGKTFTGGNVVGQIRDVAEGAAIMAHENVLQRLSNAKFPFKGLPMETYFGNLMKLSHFFNNEGIVLYHVPNAIQDGDSIVHFRTSDVIAAGDVFTMASYPPINSSEGGSVQGVLAGLNRIVEMVVPEFRSEGGTFVIPGHGRICDMADLAYYRDMVTIIRDRVQDGIKKGRSLEQIKAAKPTEDWDVRFGQSKTSTPDMFVEAVYKSLTNPPTQKKP